MVHSKNSFALSMRKSVHMLLVKKGLGFRNMQVSLTNLFPTNRRFCLTVRSCAFAHHSTFLDG
jgi:hypothetical protein